MKGWRFFFAILALYAWLFPWLPALRSPNELVRVYLARALVDDQTLTLDAQLGRSGPIRDLALRDGHSYSSKAPGVSLLGAPVYALLRVIRGGAARVPERALVFFLRLVVCMVPAAAAAELMRRLLGPRFGAELAQAGAVVLALGTLMWPYSTLLMSHGPSAVALLASLCALDLARRRLCPESILPRPAKRGETGRSLRFPLMGGSEFDSLSPTGGEGQGEGAGASASSSVTTREPEDPSCFQVVPRGPSRQGQGETGRSLRFPLMGGSEFDSLSPIGGEGQGEGAGASASSSVTSREPEPLSPTLSPLRGARENGHEDPLHFRAVPRGLSRQGRPFPSGPLFLAGLAAGAAVLLEYTTALMWLPLAAYGLLSLRGTGRAIRGVVVATLGAIPPLLVLALYHWAAFGGPFETAYRHLDDPVFTEWHQRGFMGLGAPHLGPLLGSFFDPARGLFLYAPFLALALPGLPLLWRKDRPLAVACGSALLLYALFTAGFVYESWGWSVGPRHLTPLCPFLIPPAVAAASWLRARRLGAVPAALAIFSVAVFALVVATGPYFPPELTNPVHQLSLPFARAGLRGHDLLGMLLRVSTPWTLLPWIVGLGAFAATTLRAFVAGERSGLELTAATVAAGLLFLGQGLLGGPDRFDPPRRFLMERWEPTPHQAPGLFDPP